jgi:hypothetical protein
MSDLDRRMSEFKDDLELVMKAELMGRLGNVEMRLDRRFEDFENRFSAVPSPRF